MNNLQKKKKVIDVVKKYSIIKIKLLTCSKQKRGVIKVEM
jgi:hypothetical protein